MPSLPTITPGVLQNPGRAARKLLAVVLLGSSTAQVAHAEVGPALAGVTASANDATSVFYSPAGITRLDRPELVVQSMFAATDAKFEVDESNISGGSADNDTEFLVIPALYYVHPLGDRWRLGASINVPSGIGDNYGKSWSGRYLAEEAEIAFVAVSGVVSYKLTDHWSIGGGPIYMYTDSTTKARIKNIGENRPDGRIRLDEKGSDVGWQLGLMYEFSDSARLGAVYKSDLDPDLEDSPDIDGIGPLLEDALRRAGLLDQHVDVNFKIPAIAQLGYYQEFMDKWSFTVDGMWLNTSDFGLSHVSVGPDSLSVNTDFRDAWMFSGGLKYHYRPDLAFAVGAMRMSSPISDGRRGVGLPLDRIVVVGAGVDWQWNDLRIITNLNYVDKGDGHIDQDGGLAGRVKGSFDQNYAVVLDVQVGKRF